MVRGSRGEAVRSTPARRRRHQPRCVRRLLTAALGMPIATPESEAADAQGSVALFFHENKDAPSTKVFRMPHSPRGHRPPSITSSRALAHLAATFDLSDSIDSSTGSVRSRPASVATELTLTSWLGRLLSGRQSRRVRTRRRRRRRTRRPWKLSGRGWPKRRRISAYSGPSTTTNGVILRTATSAMSIGLPRSPFISRVAATPEILGRSRLTR